MKIVTRIEVIDVKGDDHIYRMMRHEESPYLYPISSDGKECEPVEFKTDLIRGRRFCTGPNDCIIIGWHPGVEQLLNLPINCFENVQRDIKNARSKGYDEGKNKIWNFLKVGKPETDYWWLPIPIFIAIGLILA